MALQTWHHSRQTSEKSRIDSVQGGSSVSFPLKRFQLLRRNSQQLFYAQRYLLPPTTIRVSILGAVFPELNSIADIRRYVSSVTTDSLGSATTGFSQAVAFEN
jgi:hypothetical protein